MKRRIVAATAAIVAFTVGLTPLLLVPRDVAAMPGFFAGLLIGYLAFALAGLAHHLVMRK